MPPVLPPVLPPVDVVVPPPVDVVLLVLPPVDVVLLVLPPVDDVVDVVVPPVVPPVVDEVDVVDVELLDPPHFLTQLTGGFFLNHHVAWAGVVAARQRMLDAVTARIVFFISTSMWHCG